MSTKESTQNRPKKNLFGWLLSWGKSGSASPAGGRVPKDDEQAEAVITHPDKLKSLLQDVAEQEGGVYFRRNERGVSYSCQIKLDEEKPQPTETAKPQPDAETKPQPTETAKPQPLATGKVPPPPPVAKPWQSAAKKAEATEPVEPLLILHNLVPSPDEQKMQPGQELTVMFASRGWHYRADLVVRSALATGWVVSYPERLTKVGRQREYFRILTTDADTCLRVVREAGCYVSDPDLHDVGMGGCSFTIPPDEAPMEVGAKVIINLEWGDLQQEEDRVDTTVEGIVKGKSGKGLYHVAFTGLGELTEATMLLGQLVAFIQAQRLSQRGEKDSMNDKRDHETIKETKKGT